MPLEAVAINHVNPSYSNVKGVNDPELKHHIEALYDTSPEFSAGTEAVTLFVHAFKRGNLLYLGMLKGKPIVAMGCFDDGQTDTKRLQYIVVHPDNRGRGISAKFIKQVTDLERKKGVKKFMAGDAVIHRILLNYDL